MDKLLTDLEKTQGWGVDRRFEDRPGVPKEKPAEHGTGAHWVEPEQQIPHVKIYKTVERPKITPVFGTTCPPKGLSGLIRDVAYKYSENTLRHWMLLLMADRVDVVEGIFDDLRKGKIPNLLAEIGLKSELNNSQGMARFTKSRAKGGPPTRGVIVAGVLVAAFGYYLWNKRSASRA